MDNKLIELLKQIKKCVINEACGHNDNYEILMNDVDIDYINQLLDENDANKEDDPLWFADIDCLKESIAERFKLSKNDEITEEHLKDYVDQYYGVSILSNKEVKVALELLNK